MRDLLGTFADDGGTVLLSSHLLHEIEKIADDIVVIGRGRIVTSGTKEELLRHSGALVRSTDDQGLHRALTEAGLEATELPAGGLHVEAETAAIGALAARHGFVLSELRGADNQGLEEMFLSLTSDDARQETAA